MNPTSKLMNCFYAFSFGNVGFAQMFLLFSIGIDLALKTILVHILHPNWCCSHQTLSLKIICFLLVLVIFWWICSPNLRCSQQTLSLNMFVSPMVLLTFWWIRLLNGWNVSMRFQLKFLVLHKLFYYFRMDSTLPWEPFWFTSCLQICAVHTKPCPWKSLVF